MLDRRTSKPNQMERERDRERETERETDRERDRQRERERETPPTFRCFPFRGVENPN